MANTPKKLVDPTEAALTAIQEALNVNDTPAGNRTGEGPRRFDDPRQSTLPLSETAARQAANDDRETIGQILQAIGSNRPDSSSYTMAAVFSVIWAVAVLALGYVFLPSLQLLVAGSAGGAFIVALLAVVLFAPIALFFFMANLSRRNQELRMITQSMAQLAIRLAEPEAMASDTVVTVGQAIRREVTAMGDGVERAIARAGELESLVANEVAALERAYSSNEVRMRALLQDIAHQRENLVGQAEQVRNAITDVQVDLKQDIAVISDAIAARVNEVSQRITQELTDRSDHIVRALGNSCDTLVYELDERGATLLEKLAQNVSTTAQAVYDATEQLNSSLNFKTGNVHSEFVELADRVQDMLNERLGVITTDFSEKSVQIVDDLAVRAEQIHDAVKATGDSLLLELDLRGGDLVDKIEQAGERLSEQVLASGNRANDALESTVVDVVGRTLGDVEQANAALAEKLDVFETLLRDRGAALAERFAADSGTLGDLITRHVAEFDRTVKTYGGEIVERIGARTQEIGDTLKTYVANLDSNVASVGSEITATIENKLTEFTTSINGTVATLDGALDSRLGAVTATFDSRARALDESLKSHLVGISGALAEGSSQAIGALNRRIVETTEAIDGRTLAMNDTIAARFQALQTAFSAHADSVTADIARRVDQFDDLLTNRVVAAAQRVETAGREASELFNGRADEMAKTLTGRIDTVTTTLNSRADEVAQTLIGRANEADRALTAMATAATDTLHNSAHSAQTLIANAIAEIDAKIKAAASVLSADFVHAADIATTALTETSDKVDQRLRTLSTDVATTVTSAADMAANTLTRSATDASVTLTSRTDTMVDLVRSRSEELARLVDDKHGLLAAVMIGKGQEIADNITRTTSEAVSLIETRGFGFTSAMSSNSTELARVINAASEVATGAINKSLRDMQDTARTTIEQTRQLTSASISELQEAGKALRSDTLTMFERLREGNILLQEVINSAHHNLGALENSLLNRVTEFVTAMKDVTDRNTSASGKVAEQLGLFNSKTSSALETLSSLSQHFEDHGRALADAAVMLEQSSDRTAMAVEDRKAAIQNLVATLDERTGDLEQRLARFTGLLDDSMKAAESRVRDVAKIIADAATSGNTTISEQFEAVRNAVEDERRLTAEAMQSIYEQGTQDAQTMFEQASQRFADLVHEMKQMSSDMHHELEATRADLRRGVLEMPKEAAESTAQMRKVIVDQIEALAELNRIVARHGRGLDVNAVQSAGEREYATATATAATARPAPRARETAASVLPPPDLGNGYGPRRTEAPPVSPMAETQREDWLSDILDRADDEPEPRGAPGNASALDVLTLDIDRLVDRAMASEMWTRYQRGERKAFTKRVYTAQGQKTFDEIGRKYRADRTFKTTVDRYIVEFERLLDEVARDSRNPADLKAQLTSEGGLVYTLLAHAIGRLT